MEISETDGAEPLSYEIVASVRTDPGCVRQINEDCGRHVKPNDPALLESKGLLTIVADGMGGHSAGEVASQMAVEIISRIYYQESKNSSVAALKHAFEEANRQIFAAALKDNDLKGMGTTGTALVLQNGAVFLAHVGDSRLYMVREGKIKLLTDDHSAVMEMVRFGVITMEQARQRSDKNVILRALGTAPKVEVETWEQPFPVEEGDQYLLCSDGLCDLVEDEEIKRAVIEGADPYSACEFLIALARERGGPDNITVGIVSVRAFTYPPSERARVTGELEAVT